MAVQHYENFPVASWLCPAALRPAVIALYGYARTADDLADEGDAAPATRLADLAQYRANLVAVAANRPPDDRWASVFTPLAAALRAHRLPLRPLEDLLSAFEQDVHQPHYPDRASLLDYCRRSANPIGRLLLHLYGVHDAQSLRQSDAICTALQLINFWQDLSVDLPRQRLYLPLADCARHGVDVTRLLAGERTHALSPLVAELAQWSRALMWDGAALVRTLPGRLGWELRLVVQGGLRILDKLAATGHASGTQRPKLTPLDMPALAWRALRM